MADRIHLQVVTSGGVVYDGMASELNIPLEGGSIGVLADHAPLMGAVTDGVVTARRENGQTDYISVGIGVLNVVENEVTVLVRAAERGEDIDLSRAEASAGRARERLEQSAADLDITRAEASLHRALARQHAAELANRH